MRASFVKRISFMDSDVSRCMLHISRGSYDDR